MATRGALLVYHTYKSAIDMMPDEDAGKLLKSILAYSIDGQDHIPDSGIAAVLYCLMRQNVDENEEEYQRTCTRNAANGSKGGRPKKENNPEKPVGYLENPENPVGFYDNPQEPNHNPKKPNININKNINIDKDISISNDIDILEDIGDSDESPTPPPKEDKPKKEKPVRHKYGSYGNVLLSDEDYNKLMQEFPTDYNERIERLSEYIASKGAKYKDHLATIRSWARRDDDKVRGSPKRSSGNELLDMLNRGYFDDEEEIQ
jgi:hypothetical protein